MGWEKLADLGAGIFKRWFSKDSVKERRRNKIEKLKAEQTKLMSQSQTAKSARRVRAIRKQLSVLQAQAKND